MGGLWNLGRTQRMVVGYLMLLTTLGLLFPIDRVLAIGPPNLEFSVSIRLQVRFRVCVLEEVYIWVLA